MLTADLVHVRLRKGQLEVPALTASQRQELTAIGERLIELCKATVGQSRGQLDAVWNAATRNTQSLKHAKGLRKLLLDRCTFEDVSGIEPRLLRRAVFQAAAALRQELADDQPFEASEALAQASCELGLDIDAIEAGLFGDLKENHRLVAFEALSATRLVALYERAGRQAVLLRAVRVNVTLRDCSPGEVRHFFQRLKFRRLLYQIHMLEGGGYQITIDGPFSLFQSVTKYGLQLALMLPILEECSNWRLDATVAWGKEKMPYEFILSGTSGAGQAGRAAPALPDEIERLRQQLRAISSKWQVEISDALLDLPGVGICVPDLTFSHKSGQRVHLEVMGYWSRDAVWRRVELVCAGLREPVIFAVSRRLRVSEEVLSDDLPSQLYVYKGIMSANAIHERLKAFL